MRLADPFGKLHGIRDSGRKEDIADCMREKNDGLFPDDTSFFIPHIVYFVKDNPSDLTHDFRAAVKHRA